MHRGFVLAAVVFALGVSSVSLPAASPVTFQSLLTEMADPFAVTRFPDPRYESLQASSYNRASVHRDQPGWFADSDGVGFLREETRDGQTEWVAMEHDGPGCLTKIWTPFFHYDLENHTGPNLRIYLDGSDTPVIDEPFIPLLTGRGTISQAPFAAFTARAGNLYLPIPFAKSCRVAFSSKPFYHLINYRAYPTGTTVTSFQRDQVAAHRAKLQSTAEHLLQPALPRTHRAHVESSNVGRGRSLRVNDGAGPGAVIGLSIHLPEAPWRPALLRSTVLRVRCDGETTVWCPVGDFFSNTDALHPFQTFQRSVTADAQFTCRWPMPFARSLRVELLNLSATPLQARLEVRLDTTPWTTNSMHFHATWRPDDIVPGTPFQDWNFVDIHGRGVYVGDSWTVLNPQRDTWWGEGDEKIYVDGAWDAGFPTHFGTGTEDYYGWAGGVLPDRRDEFDEPFLANVRVGGLDGHTEGFNICTRTRALDAIPFHRRLRMDMESSFGTDIRNPWNLLGYSAVAFWYALPGARDNRPAQPKAASAPLMSLEQLRKQSAAIRQRAGE